MAGYKTRSSWSAPDISFDKDGRRIRPVPEHEVRCPKCDGIGLVAIGPGVRGAVRCTVCRAGRS